MKKFDVNQYGGAPLLGLTALVVKAHGNSKADSFRVAVLQCVSFKEANLNVLIRERIGMEKEEEEK